MSNRRVETKDELNVQIVEFGKKKDSVNRSKWDSVVGGFTDKSDGVGVNFDRESTSTNKSAIVSKG